MSPRLRSRLRFRRGHPPARSRAGMTLIELMITITIVALAATGMVIGLSSVTRAHLRSGCLRISAASRYAYGRAVQQGATVRLVFDLEQHTMHFEQADGRVVLARANDRIREEIEREAEDGDESASAVDPWAAAQARLGDTLHPSFGASPFSQIEGRRFQPKALADGVRIARLYVPHEPEPREQGRGSIYFFPGGQTERAVIWLSDDNDRVYSVELHALTGRARIRNYAYEPEDMAEDISDEDHSEVRD